MVEKSGLRDYRLVGGVAIAGLATGVVLTVLAYIVARYGPQGDSWSFRGNGALIVPFGIGPAALAAGWTMLVAHFRSSPHWLASGIGALIVGLALVTLGAAALPLGGPSADRIVSPITLLLLVVWIFAAPLIAALIPLPGHAARPRPGAYMAASFALLVTIVLGFYGSAAVVQP